MNLRETILNTKSTDTKECFIEEWNLQIYLKKLSALERGRWEMFCLKEDDKANWRAVFAVLVCVDDEGKRIFKAEDAKELGKLSATALDIIFEQGTAYNKLNQEEMEQVRSDFTNNQT